MPNWPAAARWSLIWVANLSSCLPFSIGSIRLVIWGCCLAPLCRLAILGFTSNLGANPIEFITLSTGTWTLVFLLCTLAVTPLRKITGLNWIIRLRRLVGLFAFFYALLHFTTYVWLDKFFDAADMANRADHAEIQAVRYAASLGTLRTEEETARVMQAWDEYYQGIGSALKDGGNPFTPMAKTVAAWRGIEEKRTQAEDDGP